jgi:hypothetical protein
MRWIRSVFLSIILGAGMGAAAWSQQSMGYCTGCGGTESNALCCRCANCIGHSNECETCGNQGSTTYYCKYVNNWGCCLFTSVQNYYQTKSGAQQACPCAAPGGGCSSTYTDDVTNAVWYSGLVCSTPYQTPCQNGSEWTSLLSPPYYCGQPCSTGGGGSGN